MGVAVATSALGRVATRTGRYDEAEALLDEALASFTDMGAESFVAETQARLAELYLFAGDIDAALALTSKTLEATESGGEAAVRAMLYRLQGYALMRRGEWDAARAAIDESLALARATSAQYEVALSLQACASLATATGEDPAPYLDESMPILARLGVIAMSRIDLASHRQSPTPASPISCALDPEPVEPRTRPDCAPRLSPRRATDPARLAPRRCHVSQQTVVRSERRRRTSGLPFLAGVRAIHRSPELSLEDLKARSLEHRVQDPAVRTELSPHMLGQLSGGPPHRRVNRRTRQPCLDTFVRRGRLKVEYEVAKSQHAARFENRCHSLDRDRFPEVRDLVKGVPREDEISGRAAVLVREKSRIDNGDVVDAELSDSAA